jgi:argininosuccinate lyase
MSLWGSRFSERPDDVLWEFTADPIDRRILEDDVVGSLAHVAMLGQVELLTAAETTSITQGLEAILAEARDAGFVFEDSDEDVHSAVERRLGELIGDLAGKLHTGRSRNDQIALDVRLYLRRQAKSRIRQIADFVRTLVDAAEGVGDTVVASYTHLQQAQAVPLAHHLLAYAWMLKRDSERLGDIAKRLGESPLGAGASGGSSLPLDPEVSAALLDMPSAFANSMDAVGSRDLVSEYVFCCAQAMVHLSRLADEMILWASEEYGWVTYADRHTTGSSAMPQKKNPDMAELVRGRSAGVIGDMTSILALQKGLPMTYNRDFQEDKRAVFHADDTLAASLTALGQMLGSAVFDPPAPSSWVTALDVAEGLASAGVPFREAHHIVGALVASLLAGGRTFADLTVDDLVAVDERLGSLDPGSFAPGPSVQARRSPGGGSHESVVSQIAALRVWLATPDD